MKKIILIAAVLLVSCKTGNESTSLPIEVGSGHGGDMGNPNGGDIGNPLKGNCHPNSPTEVVVNELPLGLKRVQYSSSQDAMPALPPAGCPMPQIEGVDGTEVVIEGEANTFYSVRICFEDGRQEVVANTKSFSEPDYVFQWQGRYNSFTEFENKLVELSQEKSDITIELRGAYFLNLDPNRGRINIPAGITNLTLFSTRQSGNSIFGSYVTSGDEIAQSILHAENMEHVTIGGPIHFGSSGRLASNISIKNSNLHMFSLPNTEYQWISMVTSANVGIKLESYSNADLLNLRFVTTTNFGQALLVDATSSVQMQNVIFERPNGN